MAEEILINITETVEVVTVNIAGDGSVGMLHYGSGAPSPGLGAVRDGYLDTVRGWFYQKTALATWTFRGAMSTALDNTHVYFTCPDGTVRRAALYNVP